VLYEQVDQTPKKAVGDKIDSNKLYALSDALVKNLQLRSLMSRSTSPFVQPGADAKRSPIRVVRGAVLPNGQQDQGSCCFAQGARPMKQSRRRCYCWYDDLAADIKAGKMDFDGVIASPTPCASGTLSNLGPCGLMPNPKVGTVIWMWATTAVNAKAGQVQFRVDS
jgi:large subunit ribosomal protein L1